MATAFVPIFILLGRECLVNNAFFRQILTLPMLDPQTTFIIKKNLSSEFNETFFGLK